MINRPRVIAMLNQKGGVGKTTSTVNLGAALAEAGRRVCLIDLDPQAHLTLHLGIEADRIERTVYDVLIDPECAAAEALITRGAAQPGRNPRRGGSRRARRRSSPVTWPIARQILRAEVRGDRGGEYDVVLIDCPPSLGLLTLNALTLADEIIRAHAGPLPRPPGRRPPARDGRARLRVGEPRAARQRASSCACTRGQTTLAREIVADLDEFFEAARPTEVPWRDCRVLRPPIRRNIKLAEAPSFGRTIFDYAPWCPGALDYRKLARSLAEGWDDAAPEPAAPEPAAPEIVVEPRVAIESGDQTPHA